MSSLTGYLSTALKQVGLYAPEPTFEQKLEEANEAIEAESKRWDEYKGNQERNWDVLQEDKEMFGRLRDPVEEAISLLNKRNVEPGIAVDLGCGISSTPFNLLSKGWTIYAVDNSEMVMQLLRENFSNWINAEKLILVKQSIEEYEFPENVKLIIAMDSLTFSEPKQFTKTLQKVKQALSKDGVFVGNCYPNTIYLDNPTVVDFLGGWTATEETVKTLVQSIEFPSSHVSDAPICSKRKTTEGIKQFQIYASNAEGTK